MYNRSSGFLCVMPVIFFLLSSFSLSAQTSICGGSLGNNIFSNGDFGSGTELIYPMDPHLAPGFQYTTSTPPTDGSYTLTNDMSKWPFIWSTWLPVKDNSDDPNGYMMVVNASESPGIFYEQVIDNVCENTVYEFSADAINLIRENMGGHIFPDISFYINDVLQYTTGAVPQDEKWHTYGFTFTSDPGHSTLKLTLRNNAPGGGGNDLALDNMVFRACGPHTSIKLMSDDQFCENELPALTAQIDGGEGFVQWQMSVDSSNWNDVDNGNTMTYQTRDLPVGKYFYRFLYATSPSNLTNGKCNIASAPITFEIIPSYYTDTAYVCEGVGYEFGNVVYNEPGVYQHTFTRDHECDSIVTLELIHVPDPIIMTDFEITPTSCEGAADGSVKILDVVNVEGPYSFTLNDILQDLAIPVIVPAGTYTAVVTGQYGCYDEQEIHVPEGPPLKITTIQDTAVLWGHRLSLSTSSSRPLSSVKWTPGTNMSCTSCLSPEVVIKDSLMYIVEASTASGCVARDSVIIAVTHKPVRYVPNVFSPNNDNVNDVFEIFLESVSFQSIDHIVVLDRWGSLVHQQSNLMPEDKMRVWDGYSSGNPVMPGVYIYSIDYTLIDGTRLSIKGDVTVVN